MVTGAIVVLIVGCAKARLEPAQERNDVPEWLKQRQDDDAGGKGKRSRPEGKMGKRATGKHGTGAGPGGGRGDAVGEGDAAVVERFPTLDAPDEVDAAAEFAVQVSLTESKIVSDVAVRGGAATEDGKLRLPLSPQPGDEPWVLDVALTAPGFELVGSNLGKLTLPAQGDSEPALFRLRARATESARRGDIYATFWEQGRFLAKVSKSVTVRATARRSAAPAAAARAASGPAGQVGAARAATGPEGENGAPRAPTPAEARPARPAARVQSAAAPAHAQVAAPDLTLWVLEGGDAAHPDEGQVLVQSPHLQPATGNYRIAPDLQQMLASRYVQFARREARGARPLDGSSPRAASKEENVALLRGFGRELWTHSAPPLVRQSVVELRRRLGKRFQSIQIFTNSPRMPWELMIPDPPDGGGHTDFLGVDYSVARWHVSGDGRVLERPVLAIDVAQVSVLAPSYAGVDALAGQSVEVDAIRKAAGARYRAVSGTLADVRAFVTGGGVPPGGIVHFAGHGRVEGGKGGAASDFTIRLSDGELPLLAWKGLGGNFGGAHPLVFFNACEVGRAERTSGFVDGWGPAMLETGASGYIGGLWPLGDTAAADFASRFYAASLGSNTTVSVGDLVRSLRARFYDTGDPTYLAYVFYGDATLELRN